MSKSPKIDYRLLNARNRVKALEFERDHQGEFDHRHDLRVLDERIERAKAEVERLLNGGLEQDAARHLAATTVSRARAVAAKAARRAKTP